MLSMGDHPNDNPPMMMMGMGMMGGGDPEDLPEALKINTDPAFVAKKEAQCNAAMEIINEGITDSFKERVYGMFLGAFAGDACGSYLEFYGGKDER